MGARQHTREAGLAGYGRAGSATGSERVGRRTSNVDPPPSSLRKLTAPPWFSATVERSPDRAPCPLLSRSRPVNAVEAFEDPWDVLGRDAHPRVLTRRTTDPSSAATATVTVPPGRVYRIALSSRLRIKRERSRAEPCRRWHRSHLQRERQPGLLSGVLEPLPLLSNEGVEPNVVTELASRFQAGKVQQVGNDP